eukprot:TRINITY_DN64601_c0_g1_i1.p2 TRINITY_DN64601_c0_g1~~TRINITY_DN64601_c0_g1_i1.p2  ORF type:complete len:196 (-),score=55.12 TRINITY_DN64601_c0_g1_i1:254-841(-)
MAAGLSRKRRPGSDCTEGSGADALQAALSALPEIRLPASTMLFRAAGRSDAVATALAVLENQEEMPLGFGSFFLRQRDAEAAWLSDSKGKENDEERRVLQWKPFSALRLLHLPAATAALAAFVGCPPPPRARLLAEAERRSLDGILLELSEGGAREVCLLRFQEQAALIDDDKREGTSQQLLTDMFTRMSLGVVR